MAEHSNGGRTALVIGGGLAGMLAVTALTGHVDTITVVERDRYPQGRAFRKGVPQARHLHILLSGGERALEQLLPGTVDALAEAAPAAWSCRAICSPVPPPAGSAASTSAGTAP